MPELDDLSDLDVLILTCIGEARGEPPEGIIAVANVIMNRATSDKSSIKAVCFKPKQFSCWNLNDPNYPILTRLAIDLVSGDLTGYNELVYLVQGVHQRILKDNTRYSVNYVTRGLWDTNRPAWAKNVVQAKQIGNHIFFNA